MVAPAFPEMPSHLQRDPFTGFGTLVVFLTHLDAALARTVESSLPVAVLQLDLDRGAERDETHGRTAGGETIRRVAAALGEIVLRRNQGAAHPLAIETFRLGGDEFALLLPATDRAGARAVAAEVLGHSALVQTPLSIGIGIAEPGRVGLGATLLLATSALRAAKEQGGARAVLHDTAPGDAAAVSQLLGRLARQIISTGQQLAEVHHLAHSDPVTGLPNQRALYRYLESAMSPMMRHEHPFARFGRRASDHGQSASATTRHGHPFSLLLVDGDNLKAFNDRLGYAGGDQWIRTLGALLIRQTRATDLTVRWRSGDEFIVALPDTTREAARQTAERIRTAVERQSEHLPLPATVSIGVTAFPDDGRTIDDLLARVEEANRQAKQSGRNCVAVVALDGTGPERAGGEGSTRLEADD